MKWYKKLKKESVRFLEAQSKEVFLDYIEYDVLNSCQVFKVNRITLSAWIFLFKSKKMQQKAYISREGTFLLENAI